MLNAAMLCHKRIDTARHDHPIAELSNPCNNRIDCHYMKLDTSIIERININHSSRKYYMESLSKVCAFMIATPCYLLKLAKSIELNIYRQS